MNNVSLVGRLTKEPELKYTKENKAVLNSIIAINRNFTNANGERETDFINIVVFGKTAENIEKYLDKGSQIGVNGRIQTRTYENNEGKKVYVFEVICGEVYFLENKKEQEIVKEDKEEEISDELIKDFPSFKMQDINIDDDDLPF